MANEEYQRLLRSPPGELRERLPGSGRGRSEVQRLLSELGDVEILASLRDLGGHDLVDLLEAFAMADAVTDRPSVVFAYTIKAWGLATEGHPANHSALLTVPQWEALATELGADPQDLWARFADGTPEAELCHGAAQRLERAQRSRRDDGDHAGYQPATSGDPRRERSPRRAGPRGRRDRGQSGDDAHVEL